MFAVRKIDNLKLVFNKPEKSVQGSSLGNHLDLNLSPFSA